MKSVDTEIKVLKALDHNNVVKFYDYGVKGYITKPNGKKITKIVYIVLEYVENGLLFELCQTAGGMGEVAGRYLMNQLKDVLVLLTQKGIAHRDLKLENIMVGRDLNLKIADFGFASYQNIDKLKSYRGTKTYMAPEIKEQKTYDGKKADMFSAGVILFIIVQGIFPFSEAKPSEYFYNMIV
jgi:serine/threonine protein kinase